MPVRIDLVATIGEDGMGRLHIVDHDGEVFRLEPGAPSVPALGPWAGAALCLSLAAASVIRTARAAH